MVNALAASDDDESSPTLRRGRGLTDGHDKHKICIVNENTQDMIK